MGEPSERIKSKACIFPLDPNFTFNHDPLSNSTQFQYLQDEEDVITETEKIDFAATELDSELETYHTLSSPSRYFFFLAFFVVCPVGAWVFFYGGGKEKVRRWKASKGYAKVGLGKA